MNRRDYFCGINAKTEQFGALLVPNERGRVTPETLLPS